MKAKRLIIAIIVTIAPAAIAHENHDHATGVVKDRMVVMEEMGRRLLAISKRLRSDKSLDQVLSDARVIEELSHKVAPLFPPGSTQAPTAAKTEIWQQWVDFEAKAKSLEVEAEKFTKADPNDGAGLRERFRAVALTCDRCHETYRATRERK